MAGHEIPLLSPMYSCFMPHQERYRILELTGFSILSLASGQLNQLCAACKAVFSAEKSQEILLKCAAALLVEAHALSRKYAKSTNGYTFTALQLCLVESSNQILTSFLYFQVSSQLCLRGSLCVYYCTLHLHAVNSLKFILFLLYILLFATLSLFSFR